MILALILLDSDFIVASGTVHVDPNALDLVVRTSFVCDEKA